MALVISFVDEKCLPFTFPKTKLSKLVPIKDNVFAWRLVLYKLPTRHKLLTMSLDAPYLICLICDSLFENRNPPFFSFRLALDLHL